MSETDFNWEAVEQEAFGEQCPRCLTTTAEKWAVAIFMHKETGKFKYIAICQSCCEELFPDEEETIH